MIPFQLSSPPWFHVERPALISHSMWSTFSFYCTKRYKFLATFAHCECGAQLHLWSAVIFILFRPRLWFFSLLVLLSLQQWGTLKHECTLSYINPHVCTDEQTQTYIHFGQYFFCFFLMYMKNGCSNNI